jgi:nitroreductase
MRHNLSEINDLIQDRRTIYPEQYSDRKVHKEIVQNILRNACWAPTHGMTQPWRFKVFMDDSRQCLADFLCETYKDFVAEADFNEMKYQRFQERPLKSSVVIAVSMQRQKEEKIPEIEEIEAVACAVQNMYLTATAYGVGCFWSSPKFIYTPKMNEFLGLGKKDKCLGIIYLGYPAIDWPKGYRKPLEYFTEWISE